jgi:outer membrane lipoprotein
VICSGGWFLWGLALLSAGCSHALSPAVRQQIDTTLSLTQLHTTPEAYKDSIVMLGGDILSTRNLAEGTLLEVLQKPLETTDRPLGTYRT